MTTALMRQESGEGLFAFRVACCLESAFSHCLGICLDVREDEERLLYVRQFIEKNIPGQRRPIDLADEQIQALFDTAVRHALEQDIARAWCELQSSTQQVERQERMLAQARGSEHLRAARHQLQVTRTIIASQSVMLQRWEQDPLSLIRAIGEEEQKNYLYIRNTLLRAISQGEGQPTTCDRGGGRGSQ